MSDTKHTPGPWCVRDLPTRGTFTIETERDEIAGRWWIADTGDSGFIDTEQRKANARLIAEAGTVATETGLTPRQLADQRKELLAMAEWFVAECDRLYADSDQEGIDLRVLEKMARAAITKATQP